MPLRTLSVVPPGGFRLSQKLASGEVKSWHSMNGAWELALVIADFRKGNGLPAATPKEVLREIEEQTCLRLHDDPNWCIPAQKKTVRAAINRQLENVKAAADGGRILVDWLGEGAKPVPINLAQKRADVCMYGGIDGEPCPENKDGHSFLRLTAETVRAIAEQMHAKEHLKLRVKEEHQLHSCKICTCPLPLKVHVPLKHILEHTDEETLNAFPNHCWIVTEQPTQTV